MRRIHWLFLLLFLPALALPAWSRDDRATDSGRLEQKKAGKQKRHKRHHRHKNSHKGHVTRDRYPQN